MKVPGTTAVFVFLAAAVHAGDAEDLKSAVERELAAYGARDCKTVIANRTDGSVIQFPNQPEVERLDRAAALKQCEEGTFDRWNESKAKSVAFKSRYQYQVIGATGIVSGFLSAEATREDGTQRTWTVHRLETWVKESKDWRRASLAVTVPPVSAEAAEVLGVWERVSRVQEDGTPAPDRTTYAIFAANGHYALMGTPPGRAKVEKKMEDLTLEEMRARYAGVFAQVGTYAVGDGKLTCWPVVALNPSVEGSEKTSAFRIEGGELILASPDAVDRAESRYRRAR